MVENNSLWQFRNDSWSSLEEASTQLVLAGNQCRPADPTAGTVSGLLDGLAPIERFWAFPGGQRFQEMRRLFAAGTHDRFAAMVSGINRALVTETYRDGQSLDTPGGVGAYQGAVPATEQAPPKRPYFEVLVVEDLSEAQERSLREELRRWRRPDDQFVYDIVVVPSFEDAVMGVRINYWLQACVVRRHIAHRSRHDAATLAPFVGGFRFYDLMDHSPDERAQILARALARVRPELDLYLMTEISVEDLARLSHHFRRVFHAQEGTLELHLSLLGGVAERYRAPFFSALRSYSHRPTGVFHALPISHGKSILKSHWIRDMADFYGLEIFLAETSATGGGLDSLHRGTRRDRARRRRGAAGPPAAARSRLRPRPRLRDPVHPQDADVAAAGIDDPRLRPGLQPAGRGDVPRGVHDAHLHLTELPDPRLAGPGRRQAALEGFELVQKQIENAMRLREAVDNHPLLSKYMHCLTTADLIPAGYRPAASTSRCSQACRT